MNKTREYPLTKMLKLKKNYNNTNDKLKSIEKPMKMHAEWHAKQANTRIRQTRARTCTCSKIKEESTLGDSKPRCMLL
jgi:hypothetical protein